MGTRHPDRHLSASATPQTDSTTAAGAAADPAPDQAAVVPPLPFPAGLSLSMEAELIAECLYRANMLATTAVAAIIPFDSLAAPVRAAYRDAAIVAIQRINPHVHRAAASAAEAVVPGFTDALLVYDAALKFSPATRAR
jgi:hypothetical protein